MKSYIINVQHYGHNEIRFLIERLRDKISKLPKFVRRT